MSSEERQELQAILDSFIYTCGSQLADLCLPEKFKDVEIRVHACDDIIEKLYYSANFEPICVYCGIEASYTNSRSYPQCTHCSNKPSVKK